MCVRFLKKQTFATLRKIVVGWVSLRAGSAIKEWRVMGAVHAQLQDKWIETLCKASTP